MHYSRLLFTIASFAAVGVLGLNGARQTPPLGVISAPGQTAGRYVSVDPRTGDLIILYPANLGLPGFSRAPAPARTIRVVLPNHVEPEVSASVSYDGQYNSYTYRYSLANGLGARQAIADWIMILARKAYVWNAARPSGWGQTPLTPTPSDTRASWYLTPSGFSLF